MYRPDEVWENERDEIRWKVWWLEENGDGQVQQVLPIGTSSLPSFTSTSFLINSLPQRGSLCSPLVLDQVSHQTRRIQTMRDNARLAGPEMWLPPTTNWQLHSFLSRSTLRIIENLRYMYLLEERVEAWSTTTWNWVLRLRKHSLLGIYCHLSKPPTRDNLEDHSSFWKKLISCLKSLERFFCR